MQENYVQCTVCLKWIRKRCMMYVVTSRWQLTVSGVCDVTGQSKKLDV